MKKIIKYFNEDTIILNPNALFPEETLERMKPYAMFIGQGVTGFFREWCDKCEREGAYYTNNFESMEDYNDYLDENKYEMVVQHEPKAIWYCKVVRQDYDTVFTRKGEFLE